MEKEITLNNPKNK